LDAWRKANYSRELNGVISKAAPGIRQATAKIKLPANLQAKIRKIQKEDERVPWDRAIARIVLDQNRKGHK
jgi:hypothetical protein